jgi:hypothetical protein
LHFPKSDAMRNYSVHEYTKWPWNSFVHKLTKSIYIQYIQRYIHYQQPLNCLFDIPFSLAHTQTWKRISNQVNQFRASLYALIDVNPLSLMLPITFNTRFNSRNIYSLNLSLSECLHYLEHFDDVFSFLQLSLVVDSTSDDWS